MKISASIKSSFNQHEISVQTNDSSKELKISPKATGFGSAVNGGELLLLALATCTCNDLYREAGKRSLNISNVDVTFNGEFGADGEPGSNFTYKINVVSDSPSAEIQELIAHTDRIAEIHNTLRKGLPVTLVS